MTKAVQKITLPPSRDIPFNKLVLRQANVRHVKAGISIASLLPTQTRRSLESESLQQFLTLIGLAFVASRAVAITPADVVLEPSAGTGLLAIMAELDGVSSVLNEFADSRALAQLFPAVSTTQFDVAHINDHVDASIVPDVVLMNPPFSAIELSGFSDAMRDRLRAYGLLGEIISSKLRMFVPTDTDGIEIPAKVLDHYPIEHIVEREAA